MSWLSDKTGINIDLSAGTKILQQGTNPNMQVKWTDINGKEMIGTQEEFQNYNNSIKNKTITPVATTPTSPEKTLDELLAGITVPYANEVLPDTTYKHEPTPLEKSIDEILGKRITGEGIERVTPDKVKSYIPMAEQINSPAYLTAMENLKEEWASQGRSFDTSKIPAVGRTTMEYGAKNAALALQMAESDVNRINEEMGKTLSAGMTFSQIEDANDKFSADQQFQVNQYKRKVRDEVINGLQNEKIKWFYTNLSRAWDTEDWEEYKELALQLKEAGAPQAADYFLNLLKGIAPVAGALIAGPAGAAVGAAVAKS